MSPKSAFAPIVRGLEPIHDKAIEETAGRAARRPAQWRQIKRRDHRMVIDAGQILIIGAGGHAKVVIDALRQSGEDIAGLLDDDGEKLGTRVMDLPVLGGEDFLSAPGLGPVRVANGLAAPYQRAAIFHRFKEKEFAFVNVIHPSAVVAKSVELGEGAQIMAGAVVQPDVRIGENALVNTRASIDHDCILGAHVHVAPGVTLAGNVAIGDASHIGAGATVLENIRIGAGCTIGAGAVVIRDVADGMTVTGVPAQPQRDADIPR